MPCTALHLRRSRNNLLRPEEGEVLWWMLSYRVGHRAVGLPTSRSGCCWRDRFAEAADASASAAVPREVAALPRRYRGMRDLAFPGSRAHEARPRGQADGGAVRKAVCEAAEECMPMQRRSPRLIQPCLESRLLLGGPQASASDRDWAPCWPPAYAQSGPAASGPSSA